MNEIDKYYTQLSQAYDSNECFFAQNRDRVHNAIITRVMLEKAQSIHMFCGSLSVFTKEFYNKFSNDYSAEVINDIKSKITTSLGEYIKDENKELVIILENQNSNLADDFIIPYENFKKSRNVKLYVIEDFVLSKSKLNHFAFTEEEHMVRLETDKKDHEAICKVGGASDGKFSHAFENLLTVSKRIF